MLNSLYAVVALSKEELMSQFPTISVKHNIFENTEMPYYLIELPLSALNVITINKKKLTITGHHLTLPKENKLTSAEAGKKKESKAEKGYHYTLVMNDDKKNVFKIHIHFDEADRNFIDPTLLDVANPKAKGIKLNENENEIKKLTEIAFPAMGPIIIFARALQKQKIADFSNKKKVLENQLWTMSKDVSLETQMDCIKNLIIVSKQIADLKGLKYDKIINTHVKLLESLEERSKLPIEETIQSCDETISELEEEFNLLSLEDEKENEINVSSQPKKTNKINLKYEEHKNWLITANQLILDFKQSKDKMPYMRKMIHCAVDMNSLEDSPYKRIDICRTYSVLTNEIEFFFSTKESKLNIISLYLEACKANLITLDDNVVIEIIEKDNHKTLSSLISSGFLVEGRCYISKNNADVNYTPLELCAYFKSFKCMDILLKNKYSFVLQDKVSEPLRLIFEDVSEQQEWLTNLSTEGQTKLMQQVSSTLLLSLKKKIGNPELDKDEIELIKIRIEIVEINQRIISILKDRPMFSLSRNKMFAYGKRAQELGIDFSQAHKNMGDIKVERAKLEMTKSYFEFLKVSDYKHLSLFRLLTEVPPECSKDDLTEFMSFPKDKMILQFVAIFEKSTENFSICKDIVKSKVSYRFDQHRRINFMGNKQTNEYFIKRIEAANENERKQIQKSLGLNPELFEFFNSDKYTNMMQSLDLLRNPFNLTNSIIGDLPNFNDSSLDTDINATHDATNLLDTLITSMKSGSGEKNNNLSTNEQVVTPAVAPVIFRNDGVAQHRSNTDSEKKSKNDNDPSESSNQKMSKK